MRIISSILVLAGFGASTLLIAEFDRQVLELETAYNSLTSDIKPESVMLFSRVVTGDEVTLLHTAGTTMVAPLFASLYDSYISQFSVHLTIEEQPWAGRILEERRIMENMKSEEEDARNQLAKSQNEFEKFKTLHELLRKDTLMTALNPPIDSAADEHVSEGIIELLNAGLGSNKSTWGIMEGVRQYIKDAGRINRGLTMHKALQGFLDRNGVRITNDIKDCIERSTRASAELTRATTSLEIINDHLELLQLVKSKLAQPNPFHSTA